VDAVQAPGKISTRLADWGADMVSLSFHKFGGPKGVGALITRAGVTVAPLLHGGGQERGRRGGTENTLAIVGAGLAAELAPQSLADRPRLKRLRDAVEGRIQRLSNEIVLVGGRAPRADHVSCFVLPGIAGDSAVMAMDMAGVAVSSGSACSSGRVAPSHVLMAQGYPEEQAKSSLRISWGWNNTEADADTFMHAFEGVWHRLSKETVRN
jgi:cysteine desulfurase